MAIFDFKSKAKRKTWPIIMPFLAFGFLSLGQLVVVAFYMLSVAFNRGNIMSYPNILLILIGGFGLAALYLWMWLRFFEHIGFGDVGLKYDTHQWYNYIKGFVAGLVLAALAVSIIWLAGHYKIVSHLGNIAILPIVFLMFGFMVQSGVEELFFRGWMLSSISARYGVWVGIISNSLVFALVHIDNRVFDLSLLVLSLLIINLILVAILFSLVAINARHIWSVCAMHASWNWSLILWYGVPTTGVELGVKPLIVDFAVTENAVDWITGGDIGPEGSVVTTFVLTAAILLVYRRFRLNQLAYNSMSRTKSAT